jgi:hypothetical protein
MHRRSDHISDSDIIKNAIERGVKRKAAVLREAGGPLSAHDAARLLGTSPEALRAGKSLLAVSVDNGKLVWPAFQFESQAMLDAIEKYLAAVNVDEPWAQLNFLFLRLQELDGRTPVQAIRDGSLDQVILAARHFGEQGAS